MLLPGLESVGVPMTTMLAAELAILAIGDAMHIALVSDFCRFARIALLLGYFLEMTFFISILAITVKCVEVTELPFSGFNLTLFIADRPGRPPNLQTLA